MSAVSQVSICNKGLTYLGAKRITSLTDGTPNAAECNAIYDETLEDVLIEHPWSFAQKRYALGTLDESPVYEDDGVSIVYSIPADLLKLNFYNIESALVKIEGNRILSNTSNLNIKYTYLNTDPQSYSKKFVVALAYKLAADLAFAITSSRSVADDLEKKYTAKLLSAIALDSQQSTPLQPIQDSWTSARISGSAGGLRGRTGDATWTPYGC